MRINDASNQHLSLYHLALRWAIATSTDFPFNPDFLQSANLALDKVSALIMRFDNTWEYDDSNNTDLPIATTDLVAGQDQYSIATSHLKILRVRVTNRNGDYVTLSPKNRGELNDRTLDVDGTPLYYDKLGGNIFILPKPDYSGTIELQTQRGANHFATSDTVKEPGFNSLFHELVALYPSLDYTEIAGMDKQANKIRARIGQEPVGGQEGTGLLGQLATAMMQRDADRPQSLGISKSNRGIGLLI
jgi:hypothetical protein